MIHEQHLSLRMLTIRTAMIRNLQGIMAIETLPQLKIQQHPTNGPNYLHKNSINIPPE